MKKKLSKKSIIATLFLIMIVGVSAKWILSTTATITGKASSDYKEILTSYGFSESNFDLNTTTGNDSVIVSWSVHNNNGNLVDVLFNEDLTALDLNESDSCDILNDCEINWNYFNGNTLISVNDGDLITIPSKADIVFDGSLNCIAHSCEQDLTVTATLTE